MNILSDTHIEAGESRFFRVHGLSGTEPPSIRHIFAQQIGYWLVSRPDYPEAGSKYARNKVDMAVVDDFGNLRKVQ